ncbi:MAG: BatA domain-containing protein [Candidatus Zixiibacteriota bacterium]
MFNFLNPAVLFAAVAALIPLIIHLFSRRRLKVVEFSSLKHLQAMQKRQVRRLKIRQLLLLFLRMAIILAIVLAFARPTTTGGSVGAHASVSAVILFDNSASMSREVSDGNLLDLARKRTQQLLETFGESDEVAVIPLTRAARGEYRAGFSSAAIAAERLQQVQASSGRADLESGIDAAIRLLAGAVNLNKEMYIVTDRQRQSLPDRRPLGDTDAQVYLVELALTDGDNCGVTALDFGGQLLVPGHEFDITATVKNYGSQDRSDIIASLYLDGRRVAQTDVSVGAGLETSVRFAGTLTRGGFHSGYVELSDDPFAGDNRCYFSLHIPQKFNVLIIDGDGAGQFLALALAPTESSAQYWSVKLARPDQLAQIRLNDYDVVMLAGAPALHDTYVTRLKSFVRTGKGLSVTYDLRTDIEHFNRDWSEVTGVVFDEAAPDDFTRAGYYTLETWEAEHPIFSVFDIEQARPPQIKFYTLPRTRTQDNAATLAWFSGNRPALVESNYGRGRLLTFCGPVLPQYSDLTGHAFFVPFVARTAEYLVAQLSSYDVRLYADEQISRSISWKGSVGAPLEVTAPDSSVFQVPPVERKGSLVITPESTDMPGIYRVSYIGREVDRFAINLNPLEGDLSHVDPDQFATAIGANDYHWLPDNQNLAAAVAEFRFGKELWHIFLWVAVILLAVEMLLARTAGARE